MGFILGMAVLITTNFVINISTKSQVRPDVLTVDIAISGALIPSLGNSLVGSLLTLSKLHMILTKSRLNARKGRIGILK